MSSGFVESIKELKINKKYKVSYKGRNIFGKLKYKKLYGLLESINLSEKKIKINRDDDWGIISIKLKNIMKIDSIEDEAKELAKIVEGSEKNTETKQ